ncbi:uncharacterized protein LOC117653380 [Thrips palmi]|uniref:Uncharacterized protein LOC117653380 n=1 Tax=Thrips palmi TaxID=161013 RepID=A0A6P9AC00_THRPL|nr:uncharacterized protein LOC117653380 [Thrips palmi]
MYSEERRRLRVSRQAAARFSQVKLKSSMKRARLQNRPRIPHSLKDFDKILRQRRYRLLSRTMDGKDSVYAGRAGSASARTISLVFMTKRMAKYTKKVKKIFVDGTFSPVPRGVKASQVWTISTVRRHHVIPLVRVLMRKRTTASYRAALEKIKEVAPRLRPKEIMSDFEGAQQRALREAFPDAESRGCLFHYAKDVGGKARKLRMAKVMKKSKPVRTLVRWMGALPLLPRRRIWEGFKVIGKEARKKNVMSSMLKLFQYWCRTWKPKIPVLSVCGSEDRTNNAQESENKMFQDAVAQRRPNVWDFTDGVLDIEDRTEQDIKTLDHCRSNASRIRATAAVCNDEVIKGLTADLKEGSTSVRNFLKQVSYCISRAVQRGLDGRKNKKKL